MKLCRYHTDHTWLLWTFLVKSHSATRAIFNIPCYSILSLFFKWKFWICHQNVRKPLLWWCKGEHWCICLKVYAMGFLGRCWCWRWEKKFNLNSSSVAISAFLRLTNESGTWFLLEARSFYCVWLSGMSIIPSLDGVGLALKALQAPHTSHVMFNFQHYQVLVSLHIVELYVCPIMALFFVPPCFLL